MEQFMVRDWQLSVGLGDQSTDFDLRNFNNLFETRGTFFFARAIQIVP